ncbi:MAG: hypothetical protein ABID61_04855 [Candidatus Micrarchaeota archaeon]
MGGVAPVLAEKGPVRVSPLPPVATVARLAGQDQQQKRFVYEVGRVREATRDDHAKKVMVEVPKDLARRYGGKSDPETLNGRAALLECASELGAATREYLNHDAFSGNVLLHGVDMVSVRQNGFGRQYAMEGFVESADRYFVVRANQS